MDEILQHLLERLAIYTLLKNILLLAAINLLLGQVDVLEEPVNVDEVVGHQDERPYESPEHCISESVRLAFGANSLRIVDN